MMKKLFFCLVVVGAMTAPAFATTYDATASFDNTNNAGSVFTYGTTGSSLNGMFSLFTVQTTSTSGGTFNDFTAANGLPLVGKVGNQNFSSGTVFIPANTLDAHPSSDGQYADIRFTAPSAGVYDVAASFYGNDNMGPTSTDVHVYTGGADVYSGNVNTFGQANAISFNGPLTLTQGQTVDFAVGYGVDQAYNYDSTGLSVVLTSQAVVDPNAVPEPASIALLGLGLLGFAASRRKSAKK